MSNSIIQVVGNSTTNLIETIDKKYIKSEDFFVRYQKLKNLKKIVDESVNRVEAKVTSVVDENIQDNIDGKIVVPCGKITRIFDTIEEKEIFDLEAFKTENPELYKKYSKTQVKEKKGSIRITPDTLIKKGLEESE